MQDWKERLIDKGHVLYIYTFYDGILKEYKAYSEQPITAGYRYLNAHVFDSEKERDFKLDGREGKVEYFKLWLSEADRNKACELFAQNEQNKIIDYKAKITEHEQLLEILRREIT